MKAKLSPVCVALVFPTAVQAAETPMPTGVLGNGVEWSIAVNDTLPLVRGEKSSAYTFTITSGVVTVVLDDNSVKNVVGPSTVLLVGKVIALSSKEGGAASTGNIQRVSAFKVNGFTVSSKPAIQPATFPLARFDIARSFAFAVEGPPIPDNRPKDCTDRAKTHVRLIVDGTPVMVPGSTTEAARFWHQYGYMGKARSIDWSISGKPECSFNVVFGLVED